MTLPEFSDTNLIPPNKPKAGRWWKVTILVVGVLAVIAVVIGTTVLVNINAETSRAEAAKSAAASASASASAQAQAQADAQASLDAANYAFAAAATKALQDAAKQDRIAAEAKGWTYSADYLFYSVPKGTLTCPSRYKCLYMEVTTDMKPNGCPGGVSVNLSFFSASDVSVYSAVRTTGALRSGEKAQLDFTDLSGQGASYRVDSMHCY